MINPLEKSNRRDAEKKKGKKKWYQFSSSKEDGKAFKPRALLILFKIRMIGIYDRAINEHLLGIIGRTLIRLRYCGYLSGRFSLCIVKGCVGEGKAFQPSEEGGRYRAKST